VCLMKYLRSAMRRSKHRKPPSLSVLQQSIREKSPSITSDCDADDEGFMSSGDGSALSRPPSLTIFSSSGPYCPRRPNLNEILANTASPPWTLAAFMAYLSQNHCLETLEFTMDSDRYTSYYQGLAAKNAQTPLSPEDPECVYVVMLWQKLLDAYIAPNAPKEINLPSAVRDRLMCLPCTYSPPDPAELKPAVKIIHELMDESVLVPFLNSVAPPAPTPARSKMEQSPWTSDESMMDPYATGSMVERSQSPANPRHQRDYTPPFSGSDLGSPNSSNTSPRTSHLIATLSHNATSRLSSHVSPSTAVEHPDSLTDDSTDSPSPSAMEVEPMTPPNTPPTSDLGFAGISNAHPIRSEGGGGGSWRKVSAKLGWKRGRTAQGPSSGGSRHRDGSQDSGSSSGL
jgi:hypothetical protein